MTPEQQAKLEAIEAEIAKLPERTASSGRRTMREYFEQMRADLLAEVDE